MLRILIIAILSQHHLCSLIKETNKAYIYERVGYGLRRKGCADQNQTTPTAKKKKRRQKSFKCKNFKAPTNVRLLPEILQQFWVSKRIGEKKQTKEKNGGINEESIQGCVWKTSIEAVTKNAYCKKQPMTAFTIP